jgi:hypothetical protein
MDPARPGDFDFPDHFRAAQAEVHAWIARAGIAGAGRGVIVLLPAVIRCNPDARA